MTTVEFSQYWEEIHGPIGAAIPGLRKLVQSIVVKNGADKAEPDFDGMAELWFDDFEALLAARKSPQWQAASEDETNFIDPNSTAYFVSEERQLL